MRDFAADRQPQAGTSVFSSDRSIGLLEGLKDDPVFVGGNTDTAVDHRKGEYLICVFEGLVAVHPSGCDDLNAKRNLSFRCELERVGEKVFQDLLQSLLVRKYRLWHSPAYIDGEGQIL